MSKLLQLAGGLALAVACAHAGARMHQICYESEVQPVGSFGTTATGIVGCAIDGGGSCTITPGAGMTPRSWYPTGNTIAAPGNFEVFNLSHAGPMIATITFRDSNSVPLATRTCTINARGSGHSLGVGYASLNSVLTGFTTDSSGLVTTGIWRLQAPVDHSYSRVSLRVPADFVAIGGGVEGTNHPSGALIAHSARDWNVGGEHHRNWRVKTAEGGGAPQQHRATAYAIGLRIEGMAATALNQLITPGNGLTTAQTTSPHAAHPAADAFAPAGWVVIGGGFMADADGTTGPQLLGQFATHNAPTGDGYNYCTLFGFGSPGQCTFIVTNVRGWRAESKDHVISAPGTMHTQVQALPPTITVGGQTFNVVARYVSATSGVAAHPSADVGGLRGQFALTGIGAVVNWRRFDQNGNQTMAGNLLWKLVPRADLGGASVASKDHVFSSPASITAHAIGIQLVP